MLALFNKPQTGGKSACISGLVSNPMALIFGAVAATSAAVAAVYTLPESKNPHAHNKYARAKQFTA